MLENPSSDNCGARYECIYKNLIRDLRQHFSGKFDQFLMNEVNQTDFFGKNTRSKYETFPFLILRFAQETFDRDLVESLNSDKSYPEFIKSFALALGSFLLPKFAIRSFSTISEDKVAKDGVKKIVFRDCQKGTLFVTKENSPFMRSIRKMVVQGTSLLRHVEQHEVTEPLNTPNECQFYDITTDFFGVLQDMDLKDKKMHVL